MYVRALKVTLKMLKFILKAMGSQPGEDFEQRDSRKINQNII